MKVRIRHIHSHIENMVPSTHLKLYFSANDLDEELPKGHFNIERIIRQDHKNYLVRWAGFTKRHDSWLPTKEVPEVLLAEWNILKQPTMSATIEQVTEDTKPNKKISRLQPGPIYIKPLPVAPEPIEHTTCSGRMLHAT